MGSCLRHLSHHKKDSRSFTMDWFMVRELKLTAKPHDHLLSNPDPLILNGGGAPPSPNKYSKSIFIIRGYSYL